jgi:hypothetical protein
MAEKPEYRALIQPVRNLSEAEQRKLLARFEPAEVYVCKVAADFENFVKQMRPPRIALVVSAGLLAEQKGRKSNRVDEMVAVKVAIHKRGCSITDNKSRNSLKSWVSMAAEGDDVCRRLAQGAKSVLNGRKGSQPLSDFYSDTDLRDLLRVLESKKYRNWRERKEAIKRLAIKPMPGRTWCLEKLPLIARSRGLLKDD